MKRKGEGTANGEKVKERREKMLARQKEAEERAALVLWKRPLQTLDFFFRELYSTTLSLATRAFTYRKTFIGVLILLLMLGIAGSTEGPHKVFFEAIKKKLTWSLYWVGLGVLSSIGLGTGLHTFLLYLGPHIASVTRAAYTCGGLNFPEPPYPLTILCPDKVDPAWAVSVWNIVRKIHLEAVMWGAGTALGELPPYFMARAARLSGHDPDPDDAEELAEFQDLQKKKEEHPEELDVVERAKLMVEGLVHRVGFLGILLCASIPNPLFDLAGITCGHFLVPFWTFFGATLIGKAIIKMSLQAVFVILTFSDVLIERLMYFLQKVPFFGLQLQSILQKMLEMQKTKLHGSSQGVESGGNPLATVFESFVLIMVCYFIISIVNSFAQNYHKKLCKEKHKED